MANTGRTQGSAEVEGLNDFLRSLRGIDKEISNKLRQGAMEIADDLVSAVRSRAQSQSPQAELATQTIKAVRDRIPVIRVGGPTKVSRADGSKVAAGDVYFGADYGAMGNNSPQFPRAVKAGKIVWPTVRAERANIVAKYQQLMDNISAEAFPQ